MNISPLLKTYSQFPITLEKGKGSYVWDDTGKKYLDFYGGHAVCILGHCPKTVTQAVTKQLSELMFFSNIFKTKPAQKLAELLVAPLQPDIYQVYFANSGSEANETAIKIARKHTGKKRIISFKDAFHGRSITSLGVTGIDTYHKFEPNIDEYTRFARLGDMKSVQNALCDDTAAVICEPIQSVGGIKMADTNFYQELAVFCKKNNILLIIDEVQTGLGRTGEFWYSTKLGIQPDMITSAKAIASGLPISAVLIHENICQKIEVGDQATTFGGGPIPCTAGIATVEAIQQEGFMEEVVQKSDHLKAELLKIDSITHIRGEGLLMGIELEEAIPDLVKDCLEQGLIIGGSMVNNVYRIMPPLSISYEEIDEFLEIFNTCIKNSKVKTQMTKASKLQIKA
jgi:acetylornithine/succinyldiaminopimelate/putrescine aminotransferase